MFAPPHPTHAFPSPSSPSPHPDQRPMSAQGGVVRRRSLSWRAEAGLPPPPSEIDQYADLSRALTPSGPGAASRSRSPTPYDAAFGPDGLGQPTGAALHGGGAHAGAGMEQQPMNAVNKHPKLSLKIVLASTIFEAGGTISGRIEIASSTSQRLRLGEIAVELEAFEELSSRDHAATQMFLYNRTLFQGEHLPPSNAVLPSAPINGYWTARKGRTTFPFSFRLPASAPSSVQFAGNASLRYALKATAQTWWNDTKSVVTARTDAMVVERWEDEHDARYAEPVEAVADTRLFMGGNGAVWLEAGTAEQLYAAGGNMLLRCGIKNNTKRHLSGLKVSIARRLIFPVSGPPGAPAKRPSLEPQITEVLHTQHFKGAAFEFPPNEEVVVNLSVDLPREIRTIRKTRLFEVQTLAVVSAQMGNFAKDLNVEIPCFIAHTTSLQRPAEATLDALHPRHAQHAHQVPRSHSSMGQHGAHAALPQRAYPHHQHAHASPGPDMRAMEAFGAERGWSPAPMAHGPPSRPASAAAGYGAAPFSPVMGDAWQAPHAWPQQQQGWGASAFLAQSAALLPRSASAAPDARAQSAAGWHPHQAAQYANAPARPSSAMAHAPPQRSVSASPGPEAMMYHTAQQQRRASAGAGASALQTRSYLAPGPEAQTIKPHLPAAPLPLPQLQTQFAPPQAQAQAQAQSFPQLSQHALAHHQQQQQQQQQQSSVLYTPQASSPSPLVPASQLSFVAPSPASPTATLVEDPLGLATINEDSESAAGTVRSVRALLAGAGAVGSVSKRDVLAFEEMVECQEDTRERMRSMGMVPEDQPPRSEEQDKTLPGPPAPSAREKSSLAARPRASDLFGAPPAAAVAKEERDATLKLNAAHPVAQMANAAPVRAAPTSQSGSGGGGGLTALESRLRSSSNTASPDAPLSARRTSDAAPAAAATAPAAPSERRPSGALRAAAAAAAESERLARADAERAEEQSKSKVAAAASASKLQAEEEARDRERNERRRKREERERAEAVERENRRASARAEQARASVQVMANAAPAAAPAPASTTMAPPALETASTVSLDRSASSSKGAPGGERKSVDIAEVRQLNRAAVSRVGGWMAGTPAASSVSPASPSGVQEGAKSSLPARFEPELGPTTPPASFLVDADRKEEIRKGYPFPASPSAADAVKAEAPTAVPTALSPALRSLVDKAQVRPAPKPGTAILSREASRRFSTELKKEEKPTPDLSSLKSRRTSMPAALAATKSVSSPMPSNADRGIPGAASFVRPAPNSTLNSEATKPAESSIAIPLSVRKTLLASPSPSADSPSSKAYDARSARGGRGGRVTSVASMWASIAEGKDGSPISPTATARPTARVGGTGGAPALDFSRNQRRAEEAASAGTAAAGAGAGAGARKDLRSAPLKSGSAPHFLNTTIPRAVFAATPTTASLPAPSVSAAKPVPRVAPEATRRIVSAAPASDAADLRASRREISTRIAEDAKSKPEEIEKGLDVKPTSMEGRGTTRAIGKAKLNSLRSMWEQ